jgi:hypothetical protein
MKQRDIKFRGMDIMGRWFIGLVSISQGKNGQPAPGYYISNSAGQPWAYQVRPETIGQYTGLKDKNGVEIYEGDRVRLNLSMGETVTGDVVMRDGCYTVHLNEPIKDPDGYLRKSDYVKVYVGNHAIDVIGNIHENPDLLK